VLLYSTVGRIHRRYLSRKVGCDDRDDDDEGDDRDDDDDGDRDGIDSQSLSP